MYYLGTWILRGTLRPLYSETPVFHNYGTFLKSYWGSCYNLRKTLTLNNLPFQGPYKEIRIRNPKNVGSLGTRYSLIRGNGSLWVLCQTQSLSGAGFWAASRAGLQAGP